MRRMRWRAFTLVEVLVVVAISAIVVALLWTVVHQVRGQAQVRSCMSNLGQLGKAFQLYLQDWEERFPSAGRLPPYPDAPWVLQEQGRIYPERGVIYPYVRDRSVYLCPSDPTAHRFSLSYKMNARLGWIAGGPTMHLSELASPSEMALLAEFEKHGYFDTAFGPCSMGFPGELAYPCSGEEAPCFGGRCLDVALGCWHVGKLTNVLFCDGHVRGVVRGAFLCRYTQNR
ncbi:MAG: hypothetical protein C4336_04935 [Armatimonadota bacterium]